MTHGAPLLVVALASADLQPSARLVAQAAALLEKHPADAHRLARYPPDRD